MQSTLKHSLARRHQPQTAKSSLTKHVVLLLHVGIVQHLVRAVDLLELLGGVLAGVGVGMVLLGELAVGRLDLLGVGAAGTPSIW